MKNKLRAITENPATGWNNCGDSFKVEIFNDTESWLKDSQFEEATIQHIEPVTDAMLQLFFRNIESWTKEITGSHAPEMIEKAITRNVKDLKEHIAKHYTINADFAKAIQHVKIADNKPAA